MLLTVLVAAWLLTSILVAAGIGRAVAIADRLERRDEDISTSAAAPQWRRGRLQLVPATQV